jgi:hypothetical protein
VPAAVGRARRGRQQRFHQRPQLVRHQVVNKGRHGLGSCQTYPKGAKRRLRGPAIPGTTAITVTTQPPGRPSGDSLDVGLPAHQGDTRQAEDTGSGEQNP